MQEHKEIDLAKLFQVLKTKQKVIWQTTGVTTFLAIIYCIFATPIFTAKTIINPPKLTDAGSGADQWVTGMFTGLGSGGFLSQKTDSDIVIAMLKADQLKNMVIEKFNLVKYYKQKDIELTRKALDSTVKFIPDMKSGFVEIDVDDKDPKLATNMANYYNIALGQLISNVSYGRSSQKQQFFTEQIAVTKNNLHDAQDKLKEFVIKNGIASGQQVTMVTGLTMQLQAQLVVAQTELQSMSLYATADNPDYKTLQAEIKSLRQQLDAVSGQQANNGINELPVPANLAPELADEYANLMRDVMINEEVLNVLFKQYEAAKIDAMSELAPTAIQVIDPALVPMHKSKPRRVMVAIGGFMLGFMLSIIYFTICKYKDFIVIARTIGDTL